MIRARRLAESALIGMATLFQVAACRLQFRLGARAPSAHALATAPILVVRCEAKIGDNLLNIPFLRALRAMYPRRPIHLLHHAASRIIYERCPYVDKRFEIAWPMSSARTLLHRVSLCAAVFRERAPEVRYAMAIVPRWDEDLYAPFLAWASGAPRIVGFSRHVLPEKAWRNIGTDLLLTDAVHDISVQHESSRALKLLSRLPGNHDEPTADLEFWFTEEDARAASTALPAGGVAWIAIAPGAALDRRKWPVERFVELVQSLSRWPGTRLAFMGTAGEAADCHVLAQACSPGGSVNLAGRLTLGQTAAALKTCRLFVGNDSGLLHLACAVRTPVAEISCHPVDANLLHANSPARFGPSGVRCAVLRPAHPLEPSCREGCIHDTAHCITTVNVGSVLAAVASLLDRNVESGKPLASPNPPIDGRRALPC